MRRTNTQSLADILKEFMSENPLVEEKMAETRALNAWEELMGRAVSQYTKRLYISKKVLYIHLSSAVLRSELSLCREQLVKRLNEKAGMPVIDDIILR